MQKIKNPYYTIYQRMGCAGEIYVNDVLVFSRFGEATESSGNSTGAIPINHALLETGSYDITGKMLPRYGKNELTEREFLTLDFNVVETNSGQVTSENIKFHPSIEQPWDGLSENINYPIFKISTKIDVELPFVLDGWQNSVDFTKINEKKLLHEVVAFYNQIYLVLQTHDAGRFLELSKEKMKLQEEAFYFSEERKKSFEQGAMQLFGQNLELAPLRASDVRLQIMGHGKLVRLVRHDGSEPLKFISPDPENQSDIELEIKLHMRSTESGFSII